MNELQYDTLDERLGRWISIAQHRGYGTMTEGDWLSLYSVLVDARLHGRAAADEIAKLRGDFPYGR